MCNCTRKPVISKEEPRSEWLDNDHHKSPYQVYQAIAIDIVHEKAPHLMQMLDDRTFEIVHEAIVLGIEAALTVSGVEDSWQPLYRRTLAAMDD